MVNASKILTVSYGTFSCTLEGFDDPFSTMRSIAEYFRDLAADDRYFGAEPPTPDAEMLHRIAEREIKRRVEARVSSNGVVLRQVERDKGSTEMPARARLAAVGPKGSGGAPKAPAQTAAAEESEDVDAGQMDAATVESVAEKLRRIRAAVARSHVEPQFSGTFAEDEHASELYRADAIETAFRADETATDETEEPSTATAEEPAPVAVEESEPEVAEEAAPEVAEEAEPEVAEEAEPEVTEGAEPELAEVAEPEAAEEAVPEVAEEAEPEVAEEAEPEVAEEAEPEVAELTAEEEESELAEIVTAGAVDIDAPQESKEGVLVLGADVAVHDAVDEAEQAADETALPEDGTAPVAAVSEEPDAEEALDLEELTAKIAEAEAPVGADMAQEVVVEADPAGDAPEAAAGDTPEDDSAEAPVARARVVKMSRRAFLERYVEVTEEEMQPEAAKEVTPEEIRASLGDTGLSQEDEDELVSELLAAEQDAPEDDQADAARVATAEAGDDADEADPDDAGKPSVEEISASLKAAIEPVTKGQRHLSVDRLMRQATTELNDNEGSRRRSAIAHLKAAVAAVRADGGRVKDDAAARDARALDQYRDDLARVVRPEPGSAPATDAAEGEQPSATEAPEAPEAPLAPKAPARPISRPHRRMPPLMLVSEQRIDKPVGPDPDAAPVRPRRVQADDEVETAVAGSESQSLTHEADATDAADDFSSFVVDNGTEGVEDLLEASAAYGTLVEGQAYNSRPQIMQRMLRHVPDGTVTREEGLRAFGVLLREGRLVRLRRGQFVLSESSRFRTEAEKKPAANNG